MDVADLHRNHIGVHPSLGVRWGESDPAGMLCRVLVLLAVIVPMAALALAWWLV
jgi:hypothetical protein